MKVIVKDTIVNIGAIGEVVNVADGYARNHLIPRGYAIEASAGNLKQFETEKDAILKKMAHVKEGAEKLSADIEALSLSFARKAGEDDKLFGSVTSMDIEAALKEKGVEIDRRKILLDEPLKNIGETSVGVKIHPEVTAMVKVLIEKEQ